MSSQEVSKMVKLYAEQKEIEKAASAKVKELGSKLKKLMLDLNTKEIVCGDVGLKATCSISSRQSLDDEKAMLKIKKLKIKGIIKKKEYLDTDALESAIYNGELSAAELADCQTSSEVITLRVKAI